MADENERRIGTEREFLWAFGERFPRSKVPRIPLDLEPPPGSTGDQFDDDYWRWVRRGKPKLVGWLETEDLSNRLHQQSDEEYAERQKRRPAADIAAEEGRRKRIRELVLLALENDDPETWKRVDELVARSSRA